MINNVHIRKPGYRFSTDYKGGVSNVYCEALNGASAKWAHKDGACKVCYKMWEKADKLTTEKRESSSAAREKISKEKGEVFFTKSFVVVCPNNSCRQPKILEGHYIMALKGKVVECTGPKGCGIKFPLK